MILTDQLNRALHLSKIPKRIISLVPSQTELLVDLGLKDSIVGVTKFCVHPTELKSEKTVVGGTKEVNYKKIKALHPDLIICNKEENTEAMVIELQRMAAVWVSDIYRVEDCLTMIKSFGQIFNVEYRSQLLIGQIRKELRLFSNYVDNRTKQKVVYLIWKKPYMCAGKNTFIDALLKLNNFENIVTDCSERYPQISLEEMQGADIVLLSSEPFPFKEEDATCLKKKLGVKVRLVDGEYFSWYGSRLVKAFAYFRTLN